MSLNSRPSIAIQRQVWPSPIFMPSKMYAREKLDFQKDRSSLSRLPDFHQARPTLMPIETTTTDHRSIDQPHPLTYSPYCLPSFLPPCTHARLNAECHPRSPISHLHVPTCTIQHQKRDATATTVTGCKINSTGRNNQHTIYTIQHTTSYQPTKVK